MANEFELSPKELKRQADALLAAADAAEKAAEREPAARSAKKSTRKKGEETAQEAPAVMTDEEARKAGILRLDDKQVAALPAASWLMNNEKLRELLARGKKKGKLDSADLMDAVDDLNLESDQMDQLYDSLEALNIDISADDALLADLPDDEPAAEEIADVEEEELVDPNTLVNSFSIDDPVRMYLKEIGKVPLLSPDEEIDLAQAMGAGNEADRKLAEIDRLRKEGQEIPYSQEEIAAWKSAHAKGETAKQKLAEANLRLVVSIAKRYVGRGMLFLDLIQEGNVGLMRAVNKFDPDKGIKFSYYAAFWIRAYILKFIMDNWRMVKIGTTQAQRKLFYNLNRERQKLIAEGFDPDAATLAERLGVGEEQIVEMQQRLDASDMSLDATVGDESGSATRMDFLPALGPGIEESLAGMEIAELLQSKIRDILPSLSEKEAYILEHRLLTDDPVTLREIGERYNVTRERVRQLEARLLQKLKTHLSTDIQDFSEDWISH